VENEEVGFGTKDGNGDEHVNDTQKKTAGEQVPRSRGGFNKLRGSKADTPNLEEE